jgi:4-hydroxybenzoate polyprenyltransferase
VAFAVFLPWLFQILSMLGDEAMLLENQEWMRITLHIVLIYTVFAFSMTLIREIVKDMEDMEGDGRFHCRTIPVVWGVKTAQIIVMVLSLLAFIMLIYAKEYLYGFGLKTTSYLLNASGVFMFMMVFGGSIFGLLDASFRTAKQFRMQSIAMKISMLIGVLSIIFIK